MSSNWVNLSWGIIDFDLAGLDEAEIQSVILKLYSSGGSFEPLVGITTTHDMNAIPTEVDMGSYSPPTPHETIHLGAGHDGMAVISGSELSNRIRQALASNESHVALSLLNVSGENLTLDHPDGSDNPALMMVHLIDLGQRFQAAVDVGIDQVRNHPGDYQLLREDEILDQRTPGLVMALDQDSVRLRLPIETSDDLSEWHDSGDSLEIELPLEEQATKRFYRLRLSPLPVR